MDVVTHYFRYYIGLWTEMCEMSEWIGLNKRHMHIVNCRQTSAVCLLMRANKFA